MSVKVDMIFDMDMPKNCKECEMQFIGIATHEYKCCFKPYGIDVSWNVREETKPEWCPLVEVNDGET